MQLEQNFGEQSASVPTLKCSDSGVVSMASVDSTTHALLLLFCFRSKPLSGLQQPGISYHSAHLLIFHPPQTSYYHPYPQLLSHSYFQTNKFYQVQEYRGGDSGVWDVPQPHSSNAWPPSWPRLWPTRPEEPQDSLHPSYFCLGLPT